MKEITNENFTDFIKSENLTIVKVGADYCNPCKTIDPILVGLSESMSDSISFGDIDAEQQNELIVMLGIRSIPTTLFYKNGENIKTHVGSFTSSQIEKMISEVNS